MILKKVYVKNKRMKALFLKEKRHRYYPYQLLYQRSVVMWSLVSLGKALILDKGLRKGKLFWYGFGSLSLGYTPQQAGANLLLFKSDMREGKLFWYVVLIPKRQNPLKVIDYMPISLIHSFSKITS
jgi:hypothetical protein